MLYIIYSYKNIKYINIIIDYIEVYKNIYYKELAHLIAEIDTSQDLQLVGTCLFRKHINIFNINIILTSY